jgi:hypothetical protein
LELAATIASLWNVGVGRALVIGISDAEHQLANETFALLHNNTKADPARNTELAYVKIQPTTKEEKRNVPKLALNKLQNITKQHANGTQIEDEVEAWFGLDPDRWKYIYFTEPDLLLTTRVSAFPGLSEAIDSGMLLAAHRLEPLPHRRNFEGLMMMLNDTGNNSNNKLINDLLEHRSLPNHGVLAAVHELSSQDACCDQGSYHPANRQQPSEPATPRLEFGSRCGHWGPWMHCGFFNQNVSYSNQTTILDVHRRIVGYPLFTVEGGLGAPLVHAGQRVCVPKRGPAICTRLLN